MSLRVFKAACKICGDLSQAIFLGGGEPTMHPLFEQFFGIATLTRFAEGVGVITNGTNKDITMSLLDLARKEKIFAKLSYDTHHDIRMVDNEVIDFAKKHKLINSVSKILAAGRASDWGEDGCTCEDLFIAPNGDIYPCGCKITKLGNVLDKDFDIHNFKQYLGGECEKDILHDCE